MTFSEISSLTDVVDATKFAKAKLCFIASKFCSFVCHTKATEDNESQHETNGWRFAKLWVFLQVRA